MKIPDFVHDHDEELEYHPMMDYGLESDHPRVYAEPPSMDPISMYSMRRVLVFILYKMGVCKWNLKISLAE
ncbi:hypothetical protein Gohar_016964 [Gossypium harknessii]|uniref:Uncharacterized protein n=1 Tax=Gossypium harknessii TaxID=34285 RepID=A0A7J9G4C8_9ROSI|nr:hypothetical protein [Gossypium harknessii]